MPLSLCISRFNMITRYCEMLPVLSIHARHEGEYGMACKDRLDYCTQSVSQSCHNSGVKIPGNLFDGLWMTMYGC